MSKESKMYEMRLETAFRKESEIPPFSADEFALNPQSTLESALQRYVSLGIIQSTDLSDYIYCVDFQENETLEKYIDRKGIQALEELLIKLKNELDIYDKKERQALGEK